MQGWGAGASRRQVFLAPWSRICLKKKQEPSWSRLEKRSGARAAKKLASSSALLEDKKHNVTTYIYVKYVSYLNQQSSTVNPFVGPQPNPDLSGLYCTSLYTRTNQSP